MESHTRSTALSFIEKEEDLLRLDGMGVTVYK